ncbi:uncharacterized protein BX664DRAFT_333891 [Halteromyces radiatus]|uniref:uncharacterized protein n=1 Tax=Halteromyces radiatus TaxID=101107 RepID=UPI00221EDEE8|nr:uncharacterized protein BX664DRAFT_333891 [Halteromyces radiatus]KAI8089791.1 transmembrane protein [Halteromyces radiatus]
MTNTAHDKKQTNPTNMTTPSLHSITHSENTKQNNFYGQNRHRFATDVEVITIPDIKNTTTIDSENESPPAHALSKFKYLKYRLQTFFLGRRHVSVKGAQEQEQIILRELEKYIPLTWPAVLDILDCTRTGLTDEEAKSRLAIHGPNELTRSKLTPAWRLVIQSLIHPFNILLALLGIVSIAASGDNVTFGFTFAMILLSSTLAFYQEYSSQRSFKAMRELVEVKARVTRVINGTSQEIEIPVKDVVPGDILILKPGDVFPGDCFIIESKNLFVSQSALTGEFLPVEKHGNDAITVTLDEVQGILNKSSQESSSDKAIPATTTPQSSTLNTSIFDTPCLCYMSTSVISGTGEAVVLSTGSKTYINMISETLQTDDMKGVNAFQKQIRKVAFLLLGFGAVMVPIVIVINGFTAHDFVAAGYMGISILVGLTPEMLPMILNTNLAYGAREMAKHKTIVRRLDSIQTIGSMNVLCSDKTGTLTTDNVSVHSSLDGHKNPNGQVMEYAYLNSHFANGLKNVLDTAIERYDDQLAHLDDAYELIEELPFDFVRRRLSVILRSKSCGKSIIVCKGAVEEMLSVCSQVRHYKTNNENDDDDGDQPMTDEERSRLLKVCEELNESGLRVLAVAYGTIFPVGRPYNFEYDERDMTFLGFVTFLDPPKPDCRDAIQDFANYHVNVKVLTGDSLAVAKQVCQQVGLDVTNTISGEVLDKMTHEEFDEAALRCTVFAKLTPIQKCTLVNSLQRQGNTVGFLGDGINDALALTASDVGISVDTATPLAKDAADLVLLEKSLQVITRAIVRGRMTHANTIKYIKMAASSNFGNVFSMLVASAWLPFTPMQANQILAQNLLYDISQIAIPWDNVDKEFLASPHEMKAKDIFRFMLFLGPLSSVFDIYTFLILWYVFDFRDPDTQANFFQTGWFYEGLITQTLIVHMIRTQKIPFLQRNPALPLALCSLLVVAIGLALPYTPLGSTLQFEHMPARYFGFLVSAITGYFLLTQVIKRIYICLFKEWL